MDMDTSYNLPFISQMVCIASLGVILGWRAAGQSLRTVAALTHRPWYHQWVRCVVAVTSGLASVAILWAIYSVILAQTRCHNCCE